MMEARSSYTIRNFVKVSLHNNRDLHKELELRDTTFESHKTKTLIIWILCVGKRRCIFWKNGKDGYDLKQNHCKNEREGSLNDIGDADWVLDKVDIIKNYRKTSMMWPSQNFLLYIRNIIKIKVNEWINNLKKYVIPPPFGDIYNMYKL